MLIIQTILKTPVERHQNSMRGRVHAATQANIPTLKIYLGQGPVSTLPDIHSPSDTSLALLRSRTINID